MSLINSIIYSKLHHCYRFLFKYLLHLNYAILFKLFNYVFISNMRISAHISSWKQQVYSYVWKFELKLYLSLKLSLKIIYSCRHLLSVYCEQRSNNSKTFFCCVHKFYILSSEIVTNHFVKIATDEFVSSGRGAHVHLLCLGEVRNTHKCIHSGKTHCEQNGTNILWTVSEISWGHN